MDFKEDDLEKWFQKFIHKAYIFFGKDKTKVPPLSLPFSLPISINSSILQTFYSNFNSPFSIPHFEHNS